MDPGEKQLDAGDLDIMVHPDVAEVSSPARGADGLHK
jgi:hypothetical protein